MTLCEAALSYVRHGWSVIPLQPHGKRPQFPLLPIKGEDGCPKYIRVHQRFPCL